MWVAARLNYMVRDFAKLAGVLTAGLCQAGG